MDFLYLRKKVIMFLIKRDLYMPLDGLQNKYLSAEAQVAVGNIHAYVPQHVRPPVASGDELQGFEAARVSSHFGVMAD